MVKIVEAGFLGVDGCFARWSLLTLQSPRGDPKNIISVIADWIRYIIAFSPKYCSGSITTWLAASDWLNLRFEVQAGTTL